LDEVRRRYAYQRSEGQLLEGTVTLLLASPLLAIAGFYDPQYALSRVFAPYTSNRELYSALQILKRIGQAIAP
jgi:hypothetical protein